MPSAIKSSQLNTQAINEANVMAAGALMESEVANPAAVKAFDPTVYAPYEIRDALGTTILSKRSQIVAPTVTNDNTEDYAFGSTWEMADGSLYYLATATTGAADWRYVMNLADPNREAYDAVGGISADFGNRILSDSVGNYSVDWATRFLGDTSGLFSVSWGSRELYDSSPYPSLNWETRQLIGEDGTSIAAEWDASGIQFGPDGFGAYYFGLGGNGLYGPSGSCNGALIRDISSVASVDGGDRLLLNPSGFPALSWGDGSGIQVESIVDLTGVGPPNFPEGLTADEKITAPQYVEKQTALGTVVSTSIITISGGTYVTAKLTASTACTFTMPTAAEGVSFILYLKQASTTGLGTAVFTGVDWGDAGTYAATATAGKMDILSFVSRPDAAGTGWQWAGSYLKGQTPT